LATPPKEEDVVMFVVFAEFPPVEGGKDVEFREWFAQTNKEFASYRGFISRRLLKPVKGGNYAAIVEHESQETFMAMHSTPAHAEASKRVEPMFDGSRSARFYEVISE
jgi:heme-degrading monooxygenase HmoA